ncbi:hypothetical protein L3Q82_008285 [Scortum barcoo]|uniref:Uncharacterized protein n=1 Tax=Scortum barcoo TaxID=214431 RepID=A0ACB8WHG2_9TELE|nr:hypothetical protein L3Q82_008285 [Scortum barcoo]
MLRRLGSFGVCRPLLRTFYETVVASVVSYAVVCWGGGCSERDKKRLNRLIKRASSVCGCPLDSIEVMGERRALAKLFHHHGQHLPPSASDCGGSLSSSSVTDSDTQGVGRSASKQDVVISAVSAKSPVSHRVCPAVITVCCISTPLDVLQSDKSVLQRDGTWPEDPFSNCSCVPAVRDAWSYGRVTGTLSRKPCFAGQREENQSKPLQAVQVEVLQLSEHGGDFRRLVVILGELDRAVEGPQAISKTDTCSFVQGGTG